MDYFLHILVLAALFAALATSLDLLVGHAGLFSVAHSAFWGIGAYAAAISVVRFGQSFWVGLVVGVILSGLLAVALSVPTLRLSGEYLLIATFAYQVVTASVFNNWTDFTGGPQGLANARIFSSGVFSGSLQSFLIIALSLLVCWLLSRIGQSPFGRALHIIREDEVTASAFGKDVLSFRVRTFMLSAVIASVIGSLLGGYITYIHPSSFTISDSILVLSMLIVGGAGSRLGPTLGACLLVGLGEAMRFTGLPAASAANGRQIVYGMLLIAVLIWRPRGLVGRFTFVQ